MVCGCPRSGTTAITKLLNSHSKIIIGMERYKYQIRKSDPNSINPSLFLPEHFLNINSDETNIIPKTGNQWFSLYEDIAFKFNANASKLDALWVGYKLPSKSKGLDAELKYYLQENAKYKLCQSLIKRSRIQHTK
ncbi:MAG: sulfotransferase [Geitlerinemataceae cyanobacterium]